MKQTSIIWVQQLLLSVIMMVQGDRNILQSLQRRDNELVAIYRPFLTRGHPLVRHVIFGQFLPPLTPVTHPGTPPKVRHTSRTPRFLEGLVQRTGTKTPFTNSVSTVRGDFLSGGFCQLGGLLSRRFCPGWLLSVPVLSECICYNRKLNITLNFMFRM